MSNTITAPNEKLLKNLYKELRILNAFNSSHQKRYLAREFAEQIKISQTTLRIYMMKGNRGIEKYKRYLPHGLTASGKSYWTQQQVNEYWGVA